MRLPPENYAKAAQRFLESIDACFAHYFWETKIRPHLPDFDGKREAIIGFHNASVQATLLSLRRINDFFANAGKRKDDLNAKDLPFLPLTSGFLDKNQKDRISKHIAHLTRLNIFEPGYPFPYKQYLKGMIPTALGVCHACSTWGRTYDVVVAGHADECAIVCKSVLEKYANRED
ncbi:MAG: hypothetical protein WCI20_11275 [bacterium]